MSKQSPETHLFQGPEGGLEVPCEICGLTFGEHIPSRYRSASPAPTGDAARKIDAVRETEAKLQELYESAKNAQKGEELFGAIACAYDAGYAAARQQGEEAVISAFVAEVEAEYLELASVSDLPDRMVYSEAMRAVADRRKG